MPNTKRSQTVPDALRPTYDALAERTDAFCAAHLNAEYATLCRELAAALARKRPSPLASGKPEAWACGIVYALGNFNYLFDKTQTPYMRSSDLCALFGVGKSTGAAKAKQIRDLFKLSPFDHHWCLPSRLATRSTVWYITVNGYIVDARQMPRDVQAVAFEKGLIPYIPADRQPGDEE